MVTVESGTGSAAGWRARLERIQRTGAARSILAIGGQGFASGTNFLTGVILGRAAGQEEYGLYFLCFTVLILTIELQSALIATPYMVYAPRMEKDEKARYSGSILVHELFLCAILVPLVLIGGVVAWTGVGIPGLDAVLIALAGAISLALLRDWVRRFCFANMRMVTALLVDAAVMVLQLGGLALLAWLGLLRATTAYAVIGVAAGVAVMGWFVFNRDLIRLRGIAPWQDFLRNWAFGKWVVASAILWAVSMNLYPWLLAAFHGKAVTGMWAACMGVVALGNMLMMGIQNFLGPKIAQVYADHGRAGLWRFVLKASGAFAVPMLVFSAVLFVIGDPLVVLIYGDEYAGSGLALFVLSLNLLALMLAFNVSRGLFAIERADADFMVNFIPLAVLLTAGVALAREHGVMGAAHGLALANATGLLARGAAFWYLVPTRKKGVMT